MPANLTPDYLKAEQQFREASTIEEKIEALTLMLSVIPKHKGTDHLQGDIKRKLSEYRKLARQAKSKGRKGISYRVPREGAGQIVMVGGPNVGKSSMLAALTNATPKIADYPFTTKLPMPGMMPHEDIQIQLVDTPPITADFMEPWMTEVLYGGDAALLVCDLGADDVLESVEAVLTRLESVKIRLVREMPADPELGYRYIRTMIVGNKCDAAGADENFETLQELYRDQFDMLKVSAATGVGLEDFGRRMFRFLRVIRIYTKEPGKKADLNQPFALREGDTVLDLAAMVHKDFVKQLKMARVWGEGVFDGQPVKREHVLHDKDIVELHV